MSVYEEPFTQHQSLFQSNVRFEVINNGRSEVELGRRWNKYSAGTANLHWDSVCQHRSGLVSPPLGCLSKANAGRSRLACIGSSHNRERGESLSRAVGSEVPEEPATVLVRVRAEQARMCLTNRQRWAVERGDVRGTACQQCQQQQL